METLRFYARKNVIEIDFKFQMFQQKLRLII